MCLLASVELQKCISEILPRTTFYTQSRINGEYIHCIYKYGEYIFNLNIFHCLNNDKRIRHKFFNLVLSSPYTYYIQYNMHIYYYIISLNFTYIVYTDTIMYTSFNMSNIDKYAECVQLIFIFVINREESLMKIWH